MNTVHRLAQAFGCYAKLTFNRQKLFSSYANITFLHSNIVFKIKVTKITQKMLFSKKKCFNNMVNYIVYLISGRAVGILDGTIKYYGCYSDRVASLPIIHVFITEGAQPVPWTRGTQFLFSNWSSLSTYGRQFTLPYKIIIKFAPFYLYFTD